MQAQICFQDFRHYVESLVGLSDHDWSTIEPALSMVEVDRRVSIQEAGAAVTKHYYVYQGLLRLFYLTPQGKDINKGFYAERHIVGNLSGLIINEPSRFAIETVEPCVLLQIDLSNFHRNLRDFRIWEQVFNQSCQLMLIRNERREAELLTMSAGERFRQFQSNFPGYLERIPQYHVASYLGITPVALSKYKRQWLADAE